MPAQLKGGVAWNRDACSHDDHFKSKSVVTKKGHQFAHMCIYLDSKSDGRCLKLAALPEELSVSIACSWIMAIPHSNCIVDLAGLS